MSKATRAALQQAEASRALAGRLVAARDFHLERLYLGAGQMKGKHKFGTQHPSSSQPPHTVLPASFPPSRLG